MVMSSYPNRTIGVFAYQQALFGLVSRFSNSYPVLDAYVDELFSPTQRLL